MAGSKLWKLLFIGLIATAALSISTVRCDNAAAEEVDDVDVEVDIESTEDMDVEVEDIDDGEELDEDVELDDSEEDELDDEDLEASVDAETTVFFVDNADNEFPAGAESNALIGFHNIGTGAFFVKTIEASFRYTQDFRYYRQNFTTIFVNTTIPAGEQTTFGYKFTPSETFDPQDVGLVINVNYVDEDETAFRDAVFNDTVAIGESELKFDYISAAAYSGMLIAGVVFLYTQTDTKKRSPKIAVERGTVDQTLSDFLPESAKVKGKKK